MVLPFYSEKQLKNSNCIRVLCLLVLFSAVFAIQAFCEAWNMKKEHKNLEVIAKRMEMLTEENIPTHFYELTHFDEDAPKYPAAILPQYAELQQQNPSNSIEEYDRAAHAYKEKALYDTGVSLHYGDQLLMLSTCSHHTEEGRFVVVAKKRLN